MTDSEQSSRYSPLLTATLIVLAALCLVNLFVSLNTAKRLTQKELDAEEAAEADASLIANSEVTPRIAFVTGGPLRFFDVTVAGARDAAERYKAELEVSVPQEGAASQDNVLRKLLDKKIDGVAISPLNATEQTSLLNQVAASSHLVTFDSDAPVSNRICYVGADNYTAGRLCGQEVRRGLPEGGCVLISVGSLDKDNGRKRRQGLIDELLGREYQPGRAVDPTGAALNGEEFTIIATILDENNAEQAEANMVAALAKHDDVDCIVGLFSYSGPSVLNALAKADGSKQVKVIAFDARDETLQGIRDGLIEATIIQDAYQFGYVAVRALVSKTRDEDTLPLSKELLFPCFAVTKDNLDRFVADRSARLKNGAS